MIRRFCSLPAFLLPLLTIPFPAEAETRQQWGAQYEQCIANRCRPKMAECLQGNGGRPQLERCRPVWKECVADCGKRLGPVPPG
jgi:hypothetical protein